MYTFLLSMFGNKVAPFVLIGNGLLATTYGWGEGNCGDIGKPVPCAKGAITASGDMFDPGVPNAAIALPTKIRMVKGILPLRIENGTCHWITINDKMNPRYIGKRGWDLSPAAVNLLTEGKATSKWSGKVFICEELLSTKG